MSFMKMRGEHTRVDWSVNPRFSSYKKGSRDPQTQTHEGKTPRDDGGRGRDWSDASLSQWAPGLLAPPEAERKNTEQTLPKTLQREHHPTDILNLDFWPPEM